MAYSVTFGRCAYAYDIFQWDDPRIAANEQRRKEALAHESTLPQYKVRLCHHSDPMTWSLLALLQINLLISWTKGPNTKFLTKSVIQLVTDLGQLSD